LRNIQHDTNESPSFRTHASYLRAFRELALGENQHEPAEALKRLAQRTLTAIPDCTPNQKNNNLEIFSCLRRGWGTEHILRTTHFLVEDSEIIRLANSWAAVQAYYVFYSALQALIIAEGKERPKQHESTQKQCIDMWVTRSFKLEPWTFAKAAPEKTSFNAQGFHGAPNRQLSLKGEPHTWSAWQGEQRWDIAARALASTRDLKYKEGLDKERERKARERKKKWKEDQAKREKVVQKRKIEPKWSKKPNLTINERTVIDKNLRPISLMDYLYRLRIKANYTDADMYANGPDDDEAARAFGSNLTLLSSATLLVHELRISKLIGHQIVLEEIDAWLKRNVVNENGGGLITRRNIIDNIFSKK
jgi:hypothetical protein